MARAEASSGHRAQSGQQRQGARGCGMRWEPVQAAWGSRAIACEQGREMVRAQLWARPELVSPPLPCAHPQYPSACLRPSADR